MRHYKQISGILAAVILCFSFVAIVKAGTPAVESTSKQGAAANSSSITRIQLKPFKQAKAALVTDIPAAYQKIAENGSLILYLNPQNLAIKIKDKSSDYVWSSIIDHLVAKENNASWAGFMSAGLSIEYFTEGNPKSTRTDLVNDKKSVVKIKPDADGFAADIQFTDLGIGMELKVSLDHNQLVVHIPNQSITESGKDKLASIYVYPFLGATRKDKTPGYLFVPDGSGALIRFRDNHEKYNTPYEAKVYGKNAGIDPGRKYHITKRPYDINFPVFGLVHGIGQYGLFGVIEQGKYNADIVAYPNGVSTEYNWVTAKYIYRQSYVQPTSRTMGGLVIYEKKKNTEDIQTRYYFLHGGNASYVGMAKTYQRYLVQHDMLKKTASAKPDIPLRLDFLGAETENGLFFKKVIPMTKANQLLQIVRDLQSHAVGNFLLVYKGWNKGGFSGKNPIDIQFEKALGSKKDFENMIRSLKADGIPLYFYNDYTTAFTGSNRFSLRSGVAKKVDKLIMEKPTYKPVYSNDYYMLPGKSLSLAQQDIQSYDDLDIERLAINNTSHILFSHLVNKNEQFRVKTAQQYMKLAGGLAKSMKGVAMYTPNDYMLPYTNDDLDIPMDSSEYTFFDDAVPFSEIVLKGYMDYYAPYSNFFANQHEAMLKMIEYGAYPSYNLTEQSSFKLKYTNSNDLYTSSYTNWKQDIIAEYHTVDAALKNVRNAAITGRTILKENVVKVSYSNGVGIFVNYSGQNFTYNGVTVPAQGFKVTGVKS